MLAFGICGDIRMICAVCFGISYELFVVFSEIPNHHPVRDAGVAVLMVMMIVNRW
jgi:hypothetical protein